MAENAARTPGDLWLGDMDGGWCGLYAGEETVVGRVEVDDVGKGDL